MKNRPIIETVLIIAVFLLIASFLSHVGRSHIVFLARPLVAKIEHPGDAYAIWKKKGIHGRILYLFDRQLNAQPGDYLTGPFFEEEFDGPRGVSALCDALQASRFASQGLKTPCDIAALNTLLKKRISPDVLTPEQKEDLTPEALRLQAITRGYPKNLSHLTRKQQDRLSRLNRLLIETAFPDLCPISSRYEVSNENYVYVAIKQGYIRKIYHIVPDPAWPEVQRNLQAFSIVRYDHGAYSLPLTEGVPVHIMRMRDIRPEQEPVVMVVNGDIWSKKNIEDITDLLRRSVLKSDLIAYTGPLSPEQVKGLTGYAH